MAETASFVLKLKDLFSSKAKKASRSLADLNRESGKASRSIASVSVSHRASASASMMAAKGNQANSKSMAMTALKAYGVVKAMGYAARATLAFAGAIDHTASFDSRMEMAFERLDHHGRKGSEIYGHVKRMAEFYGLAVDDTAKSYKNFMAMQFSPKWADKLLMAGADLQALGADAEEVKGIFTALSQIKSKGRVQAEEMLQLAERGVSQELVYDALAKNRGLETGMKGRQEIMGLQQQGEISADEFFVAFEEAINKKLGQKELGESGRKFATSTLDGMKGVLGAKATNIWKAMVKNSTPTLVDGMKGVAEKLEAFAFSPEGAKTFAMIEAMVRGVSKGLAFVLPLAIDFFGAMVSGGSETLGPLKEMFGSAGSGGILGGLKTYLPELGRHFGNVLGIGVFLLGAAAKMAGLLILGVTGVTIGIRAMGQWFVSSIGDAILWWDDLKARITAAGGWLESAKQLGINIVVGIAKGIASMNQMAFDAIAGLAKGVIGAAKNALGIKSPSKEFERLGMYTGEGFSKGLAGSMEPANDVMPEFMTDSAKMGRQSPGQMRAGLAGVTVHLSVTVHAQSSDAREIADASAGATTEALEEFFFRLADETAA